MTSARVPDRRIVVPAIGATQILAWGSTFYLLGVLANPIADETGWRYDWITGGVCLGLLVAGLVSPRIGRAIGTYGGQRVLVAGCLSLAAGLVLLGCATHFAFYLAAWTVIGFGMGAALYDAAFSTLGTIYGREARGAVTWITLFGGFASTVCWPLSAYLVQTLGWRGTCFAYAALQLCISLPLLLIALPRGTPAARGGESGAEIIRPPLRAPQQVLIFTLLVVAFTIAAAILSMGGVLLLPLLQAQGLDLASAVLLGAMLGPSQVGARFMEMLGGRHYHPIWTMVASSVLVASGTALLLAGWQVYALAIILYGAGNGIGSVARGTLPLALFGASQYPVLIGRLALPTLAAMALSPLAGAVMLQYGGARLTLAFMTLLATANVILVGMLWLASRGLRNA